MAIQEQQLIVRRIGIPMADRNRRLVFVIMPFSTGGAFDAAGWTQFYENHLKRTIVSAGFECKRANPTRGNLLSTIVRSLAEAYVVVADLTACNPNVFYELGIRHALSRRSILITQDGSQVPSDLRNYWYHEYRPDDPVSLQQLRNFLKEALKEIINEPSAPDSPVADFLRTHRAFISREEKDHYEIATRLVHSAKRRLFVVERTPVLLVKDIRADYQQRWHDALQLWVRSAVRCPRQRCCGLLFVASKTAASLDSPEMRTAFERRLRRYNKLEARSFGGGLILRVIPEYCGSFIVSDEEVGIWHKTRTNETGVYVNRLVELADAYEDLFHRLAGDVRQTAEEILRMVFGESYAPNNRLQRTALTRRR